MHFRKKENEEAKKVFPGSLDFPPKTRKMPTIFSKLDQLYDSAMTATVGEVCKSAATAMRLDVHEFLEHVVRFVTPDASGDSDPSRETILGYERVPRTRCGYKFAGMILDYLHSRRIEVTNPQEFSRAVRLCRATLHETRKLRFLHPARTNTASMRRLARIGGAYVLTRRRASGDHAARPELLVLSHDGRGDTQTFATYVTPDIVCRGTWCVIQQNVCCAMNGIRGAYVRRDVVNLQLLYEEPGIESPVLLSGFITGITSNGLRPVVLPVFAVRVADQDASSELMHVGDACDAELRSRWSSVARHKHPRIQLLNGIFDEAMVADNSAVIMNVGNISSKVLQKYGSVDRLLDKRIIDFCKSFSLDQPWD